jgi:hypothetical protein
MTPSRSISLIEGTPLITATATAIRTAGAGGTLQIQARYTSSDASDKNESFLYRRSGTSGPILERMLVSSNVLETNITANMIISAGETWGFELKNTKCGKSPYWAPPSNPCGTVTVWDSSIVGADRLWRSATGCNSPSWITHEWEDDPTGYDQDHNDMVYRYRCIGSDPTTATPVVRLTK